MAATHMHMPSSTRLPSPVRITRSAPSSQHVVWLPSQPRATLHETQHAEWSHPHPARELTRSNAKQLLSFPIRLQTQGVEPASSGPWSAPLSGSPFSEDDDDGDIADIRRSNMCPLTVPPLDTQLVDNSPALKSFLDKRRVQDLLLFPLISRHHRRRRSTAPHSPAPLALARTAAFSKRSPCRLLGHIATLEKSEARVSAILSLARKASLLLLTTRVGPPVGWRQIWRNVRTPL